MTYRRDDHDGLAKLTESLPSAKLGMSEVLMGSVFLICLVVTVFVVYRRWDWSVQQTLIGTELSELMTRIDRDMNPNSNTINEETEVVRRPENVSPLRLVAVLPAQNESKFSGSIGEVHFRPGSRLLAVSEDRGFVKLYDPESGALQRTFSERERDYFRMAFSPDGALLAASSRGGIYCWKTETGELEFSATGVVFVEGDKRVRTMVSVTGNIAFSGDGNYLAVCDDDQVAILNTSDGSTHQLLRGDTRTTRAGGYQIFRCLCFSNGTNELYMGSWHSERPFYDVSRWMPGMDRIGSAATLTTPAGWLASSRKGSSIAVHTDIGEITVMWIVPAGPPGTGPGARLKIPSVQASSLVFSSDDRFLIVGGLGNRIRFWTLDSDEAPMTFTSEGLPIAAAEEIEGPSVIRIAASDDGAFLACGCSDGRVRVLRIDSL